MTRGIKPLSILLLMVIAFFTDLYRSMLPNWLVFGVFTILFVTGLPAMPIMSSQENNHYHVKRDAQPLSLCAPFTISVKPHDI